MGKNDFISGTILEFKVPLNLGYGYCKILDFRNMRMFDGVLVKVFDHITKEPINDISILSNKDLLFGCRRMPWLPGTRGKGAWKVKGVLIAKEDNAIPDFKYCIKASHLIEDLSKIEPWYAVKNINNYILSSYEKVNHLEDTVVTPRPGIEIRTAMEYCRIHKMDIKKLFELNEPGNNITYKQMLNVPIYSTIAPEIRGVAVS